MRELTHEEKMNNRPNSSVDESLWSPAFPIDDLEDFQVCMLGASSMQEDQEWFLPQ